MTVSLCSLCLDRPPSISPMCSLLMSLPNALVFVADAPQPPTEDTYLRFDEYGSSGRPRRSAGKSQKGLNVETLVVADRKMVEKHGKGNVTTYILTVMNMVSVVSTGLPGSPWNQKFPARIPTADIAAWFHGDS